MKTNSIEYRYNRYYKQKKLILLLFSNDNGFSITQTHEICLYLKEHSSGQLVDFKNATIILIYSF